MIFLASVGCLLLAFAAVVLAGAAFGVRLTDESMSDPWWDTVLSVVTVAALLPAVLLGVLWARGRRPGTVSSVVGRVRWRWLAECVGWAALAMAPLLVVGIATGELAGSVAPWTTLLPVMLALVLAVPLQAAAEEYLCRGWLVQAISSWTRAWWPAAVIGTVGFVLLHDYTDPLVIADLAVFSIAMCWLTVRTGGLEAAVALHAMNNTVAFLILAVQGKPGLDQSGDYGVWEVLPGIVVTLAYTWWVGRRAGAAHSRRAGATPETVAV
ncbi:lysostaphin resistance A-like protein [Lentzea sp. E54]|uniref:CPBP family intramembrane glutamic endopeptidase n=1 Tax=Lentzea xerophila TaxID=3435883 RepID=UPI003DA31C7D